MGNNCGLQINRKKNTKKGECWISHGTHSPITRISNGNTTWTTLARKKLWLIINSIIITSKRRCGSLVLVIVYRYLIVQQCCNANSFKNIVVYYFFLLYLAHTSAPLFLTSLHNAMILAVKVSTNHAHIILKLYCTQSLQCIQVLRWSPLSTPQWKKNLSR